jgi:hypothetical protein
MLGFVIWNVVAGLALPFADVPMNTYLQVSVPDEFRGRTNSVREMIGAGVMPLGMSLAGIMVAQFGIVMGFLTMGVGTCGTSLAGLLDRQFHDIELPAGDPVIGTPGTLPG